MGCGDASLRFCQTPTLSAAHVAPTAMCSKESSGCSKQVPVGEIFPSTCPVPPPAGDGSGIGRRTACGMDSGELSSPNSMLRICSIGSNASWTAVSLRPKKGALRRKNQEGKGNEVDGGGGRPGSSSGKHPCLGIARRGDLGVANIGGLQGEDRSFSEAIDR